jgi:LacI family transcriptional regulator
MIAGVTQDDDRARGRQDGFLHEIAKAALDPTETPVFEGTYSISSGRRCMAQLMNLPKRPTAIFCSSDILAAGAIKYCAEADISVLREVFVVGFDNLELAELTTPELTTLEVPARDMGRVWRPTMSWSRRCKESI